MHCAKCAAYLRVSTQRQGQSGLGLEAQRAALTAFANSRGMDVVKEFVEVESGKNSNRPQLQEALAYCQAMEATLVVAKLDRLSRDAHFLLSLQKAQVDFVAADMPDANSMTIGIMALVAQQEREAISQRTKDALAAAKARGQQLGAYRNGVWVGRTGTAEDAEHARKARAAQALVASIKRLPMLKEVDPDGTLSLRQIAEKLNELGVPTVSKRGRWSANSVRRLKQHADREAG